MKGVESKGIQKVEKKMSTEQGYQIMSKQTMTDNEGRDLLENRLHSYAMGHRNYH